MRIDGYTRLAAVVAKPIKHSISPFIHNHAFQATQVNGAYVAWEIDEKDLAETVQNIKRYDMFGINLSMPYKQAVIPYLDEVTPAARLIGAVNTVVYQEGRLLGYNTDGQGFFRSLPSFSIQGQTMLILGAGGAGMAIIAEAALRQAKQIVIFTRTASLDRVKKAVQLIADETGVKISVYPLEDESLLQKKLLETDLLVNSTSLGMDGQSLPLSSSLALRKETLVADVIYQPFETPFLGWAKQQGNQTVNGLGMLLYQAASAFELWTGKAMPTKEIWQLLEERYR
ncbi:shikimate dehydrogenase [Streptococcus himalayensis]|uniref:Shikimate dehydrogenase (NADP(+)) n=1 Tax=Streptococcus himalayensis TaxID=1888195 RepID=A0A917A8B5_9STRE|nr:shikimate dehydrogenase [Streptococcus himalayensis]GGE33626.1 shikimate dehydrogenase (NADP(+)) [Streptococcus himalayensis]